MAHSDHFRQQTGRSRPTPNVNLWALAALAMAAIGSLLPANSEAIDLSLPEYQKQNWQVEDGLPENNVRMIGQRTDGRLLLATSSGLSTFDGVRFQALSIAAAVDGEAVNAFLEEKDGTLWIGTDGRGVFEVKPPGTPINISEAAGRMNERIRNFLRDSSGALWIATQNGVERYWKGKLETFDKAGMISGNVTTPFAEDGHGGVFFVTSTGLFHWSGDRWKPYPLRDSAIGTPRAVYRDPQQRLWVGTTKAVLQLIPNKKDDYDEVVRAHVATPVTVIVGDATGTVWVGTQQKGVLRIGSRSAETWTARDGLSDDAICSMFVDSAQDLWIGTQTGGLNRWREGAFATYEEPKGAPVLAAANVLADSRGDIWMGTWGQGVFRLHDGRLLPEPPPGMPISTPIRALAENLRGQMWIGTWFDGVYRWDRGAYRHYLLGTESPGNAVSAILVDRHGGLWIGTYIGLLYFPGGEPQGERAHFLESKLITCLLEDLDGSILVGSNNGLFRIHEGQPQSIAGLAHPHVLTMIRDSLGSTWIGTQTGGLALLRRDHVEPVELKSAAGLSINTAVEDGDGDFWLGTIRGIVRVKIAALHDAAEGREDSIAPVFFGREDGMRSSECVGNSTPASTRGRDGTLWFATAKGFVHTTAFAESLAHGEPPVPSVGWTFNDDPDPAYASTGDRIVIGPSQPDVTFLFNVIDLSNPSRIEFRYRLAGYDSDWIVTRARSVRYLRLPAGRYKFEVQARKSGEAWGTIAGVASVQQQNHFYQSWYAYLVMFLLVALIVAQAFRQRVQLMKGRIGVIIEERNRISRECHDTLMAGLAAISWQLEATSKIFRKSSMSGTPAANSCEIARNMVSHCQAEARRIIWDLRDTVEMTGSLSRALQSTIAACDSDNGVQLICRVEGEEVPLAPADVHHLVCIAHEAVSNAFRHASASLIAIELRYEPASLCLTIRDDGCGLRSDRAQTGHFGIPVMEERARKVGGVLRLQSSSEWGTEVSVTVSFHAPQAVRRRESYAFPGITL